MPKLEFNLTDPTEKLTQLVAVEIEKLAVPASMGIGNDNISISPTLEARIFISLRKSLEPDHMQLKQPGLFSKDNHFCSGSITFFSEHYSSIDVDTLPNPLPYLIKIKFICIGEKGKQTTIVSNAILIEI